MNERSCICSSVTLKVFWVIHDLSPDKRKHALTRHAECSYCSRPYKDISERQMQRERQDIVAWMKESLPDIYAHHPCLKRYLKHNNAS